MAAVGTERKQLFAYDRVIKTRAWTSLLIVNPKGDGEVNGLLNFCPRLRITLVWDPDRVTPLAPPTEAARRAAVLARLQVTSRATPRLRVLVDQPTLLAAQLASEQHDGVLQPFSGAILVQLDQDKAVGPQLRAWAALCAPDGMLIGKQHADLKLRAELSRVTPLWRPWPNGLWLLDVKHLISRRDYEKPGEKLAVDEPIPQEPSAKNSGEFSATFSAPGPIKPPVGMNLARTRPVWETLERNLAS